MRERTVYAIAQAPTKWRGVGTSTTWKFWTGFEDEFSGFRLAMLGSMSVMEPLAEKLKKKRGIHAQSIYLWQFTIKYPNDAHKPE